MDKDNSFHENTVGAIPRRPFGRTGIEISKLCLGGSSVVGPNCQLLLDEALRYGIDCWEFNPFCGRAFGDYFVGHPNVRERVFLTAKARSPAPAILQQDLEKALADNETRQIDFYAIHGVEDASVLTNEVRAWAERAKAEGRIRFFGFCTHKKMDSCLSQAAGLGWIDGIQTFYNYRMQSIEGMGEALRRCHECGIGILAVKSMGLCVENETELWDLSLTKDRLEALLVGHALTFEQAKLKAIWQNAHVTSVCSLMPSVPILRSNALAAMDERALDPDVVQLLATYAQGTGQYFCRRCGVCDAATRQRIPIFNVMESLMYARAYGAHELAAKLFSQIPAELRNQMCESDYETAEAHCPQQMPIGRLMREAYRELNG
ncbi:MAG: hypothetical protein ACM3ZE_31005 [Myxococcales bacterium]